MSSLLHRSTGIIISTIEAINAVGLTNLSTKEIAQREGVSEGTLFRHFKSKSAILDAVLDYFSQYDHDIMQSCKNQNLNPIETIKTFILSFVEYYENYPEITAILLAYDSLLSMSELHDKVQAIINNRYAFVYTNITLAIKQGMIKQELDINSLTSLVTGGSRAICLEWRMKNYEFSLKERTIKMLDTLFKNVTIK